MKEKILKQLWPEWKLGKRIGGGSYGVVYEATRNEYGVMSSSAIKILSIPASESEMEALRSEGMDVTSTKAYFKNVVDEFVNEIRLMVSLDGCSNIVSVKDYKVVEKENEFGWYIFILMELLTPFSEYIKEHKLSEKDVIRLGCDICTALETCAEEKIIHRDIKPGNILVHKSGTFKLGDFGIARKLENVAGGLSQRYTPKYMAPEVNTSSDYDERVDIYSLGIMLYQQVNKMRIPFQNETSTPLDMENAIKRRNAGEKIPVPCDASPEFADVILRACEFDPDKRFSSAKEMRQALLSVANGSYRISEDGEMEQTTSVRKTKDNYEETTRVRSVDKNSKKSNKKKPVDKFDNVPKKRKKNPVVIALAVVFVVLGVVSSIVITRYIDGYDSKEALTYFLHDKEDIDKILIEAEELIENGDYEGALDMVRVGVENYPKSESLQKKVKEYEELLKAKNKEKTLAEAKEFSKTGDYVSAIELIKRAQEEFGNDHDYTDAYNQYCNAYKEKIISTAEQLAENQDYLGAVKKMEEAKNIVGEDKELTEKTHTYEDKYVQGIVSQIKKSLNGDDYESAENTLSTALAVFPENQTLLAQKQTIKDAKPKNLLDVCPPYKTEKYEVWSHLSIAGKKYASGVSIGSTGMWGEEGYALFNLGEKYTTLSFTVGNIDERGTNDEETLYIYLDDVLAWSLDLDPQALPTSHVVDVSGATQMKIVGSNWAGDFGIVNLMIK